MFDVNETLSDMSGLSERFAQTGMPAGAAATWFASLLRDGFALTVTGGNPAFAELASQSLAALLRGHGVADVEAGVAKIMGAFAALPLHPDVVVGVRALSDAGVRLVTLSNGSTSVAQGLFERAGIAGSFERLLSVEQALAWKPAATAYRYAMDACQAQPDETMLVAAHPWDIHGAARAGLSTAFVNRTGTPYPAFFDRPDLEVDSITELAQILTA
ncbi:haloacid dehalogenase type II [Phycicoccus sp. Soil802]|uniref:haloacid dehalogenase type II n=1 Tax=Phycicoccus sp. Soil802 TaxID=1736414 RepID=UPI0021109C36|nr:haloacid dehalogenase type II [Phycicoccus sp. Soil802]